MEAKKIPVHSPLRAGQTDSHENKREDLRQAFLQRAGHKGDNLSPLPMDMSKRCYFRFPGGLLMDAPPLYENTFAFHHKADVLRKFGLSVPEIYAANHQEGFLLIEDFGEVTFRKALLNGLAEDELYSEVINALIHLHNMTNENSNKLPHYSLELFLQEVEIFLDWYDLAFSTAAKNEFRALWANAYEQQPSIPHSLVMRDVMVDNLLWLPEREGFRRCGFIDFQDGVWGPITYDLVSLLEDARRDINPLLAKEKIEQYFKGVPTINQENFWASYYLWGAQRSTKILGVFSRFSKRDGRDHHLAHLPRVKEILKQDLAHPSLQPLLKWFQSVALW